MTISAITSLIGKEDLALFDGRENTFTRHTSAGGTKTLNRVGNTVDVLQVYGGGATFTAATLNAAINAIGSYRVPLEIPSGDWVIDADVTFPENIAIIRRPGAILKVGSGYQVTINNPYHLGFDKAFEDSNAGLDGLVINNAEYIKPEWWGAEGLTDDTDACQAAINCVINSTSKLVRLSKKYYVSGLTATNTSIAIIGIGKYRCGFIPLDNDYCLTISGPGWTLADFGLFHDRSAVSRGIRIYHASVVTKWAVMRDLHFEKLKGCAIKIDARYAYEMKFDNISTPECGDNEVNGTNDEAVIDILGAANSDQNNFTFDTCFLNAFHGPAIRVYNANENQGGYFPGFRMLRILNSMFHGATTYSDSIPQPCNSIDLQGVSDVRIINNNFALTHEDYQAIIVNKCPISTYQSQRITVEENRLNGPVKFLNTTDVRFKPNDFVYIGGDTFDYHAIIDASCGVIRADKQRVIGGNPWVVDDRGTDMSISDANSLVTKYWYQFTNGVTFLGAAGHGTGINGCKNVGGNEIITNPDTTAAVTFNTEEDDANYNV